MKQNQLFYFLTITILSLFTSSHCMHLISIELDHKTSAQSLVCYGEILQVQKSYYKGLEKEIYKYYYNTFDKSPRIEKRYITTQSENHSSIYIEHNKQRSVCYVKDSGIALFDEHGNKLDLFMNKFVIFSLKQLQLPHDVIQQIIIKAHAVPWICRINVGNDVKDIAYDLTGKYIAFVYDHQIRFYDIHDIEHLETNFTTFPYGGFMTFHPNKKTVLILRRDDPRKILYGIDLETHKVIYKTSLLKQKGGDKLPQDEILTSCDGYYKKLAINSEGDLLAIASDTTFLAIFGIGHDLQNFFVTYNPKTMDDLSIFINEQI